jgi:DNA-directed RNA polymerase I subunit RPA2
MGTPYHNHPYRMDNKVYRILFPQEPLVHTNKYEEYDFRQYPSGTNAVVAVISYTGYDMEDAMIINKSAYERGFGHGAVYKSYIRELNEQ